MPDPNTDPSQSEHPVPGARDPDRVAETKVHAAGGVVWRGAGPGGDTGVQVLLIHRPRYDDWSLPKGKLDDGESFEAAAIREIREETGVVGDLGADLGDVFYIDHKGREKVVRWWAVEVRERHDPTDTDEVDEFRWETVAEAHSLLSYDTDRGVLERFRATVVP